MSPRRKSKPYWLGNVEEALAALESERLNRFSISQNPRIEDAVRAEWISAMSELVVIGTLFYIHDIDDGYSFTNRKVLRDFAVHRPSYGIRFPRGMNEQWTPMVG
jgi:hypothetical protein